PSAFAGLDHVGSVMLTQDALTTMEISIQETPGGPSIDQGFNGAISLVELIINLDSGSVTGGSLVFETTPVGLDTDRYEATIAAGGTLAPFVGGGFTIEGLTL